MIKGKVDEQSIERWGGNAPFISADKILQVEHLRAELLIPSIPDDITIQVICPKLSGRDIHVLSLVSPTWREAIQSRLVYDTRVRSHKTITFIFVLYKLWFEFDETYKIRIYSLNDSFSYDLPQIPSQGWMNGIGWKFISLDGKIYFLGGDISGYDDCRGVFMFDLAGQRQWKQCASMQQGRLHFSAGVLDGKIYVFGGESAGDYLGECEMYDPMVDAWSSIADMISDRRRDKVAAMGGELFLYGGQDWMSNWMRNVVAYHPVKNKWRQLDVLDTRVNTHAYTRFAQSPWFSVFVANEKFHSLTLNGIDVYDSNTNSWSTLHSNSDFHRGVCNDFIGELNIWNLGDEILILRRVHPSPGTSSESEYRLFKSTGLGSSKRELSMEEIRSCRFSSEIPHISPEFHMCFIEV